MCESLSLRNRKTPSKDQTEFQYRYINIEDGRIFWPPIGLGTAILKELSIFYFYHMESSIMASQIGFESSPLLLYKNICHVLIDLGVNDQMIFHF